VEAKSTEVTGRHGTGNWRYFDRSMDEILVAANIWKEKLKDIEKPWLCWNVNDDWCLVQQRIIKAIGWTPVVGWDPYFKSGAPQEEGSVIIDFNEKLKLLSVWPHVPLEFAFLWTDRLAFWHADLFVRMNKLKHIVEMFEVLKNGEMAAVLNRGGIRNLHNYRSHLIWELIGCTTKEASKSQFECGCGWWRNIWAHPNCPDEKERKRRQKYYYDHGVGIMYWKRYYHGKVHSIPLRPLLEGHCSAAGNKSYKLGKNKEEELQDNFKLHEVLKRLDLDEFGPKQKTAYELR
jgi:hypothetical protein